MTDQTEAIDIHPEMDIIDLNTEMFELTTTEIENVSGGAETIAKNLMAIEANF